MNLNLKHQLKLIASITIVIFNLLIIVNALAQQFFEPSTGMLISSSARVGFVDPFSSVNTAVQVGDEVIAINSYSVLEEPILVQQELNDNDFLGSTLNFELAHINDQGERVSTYDLPITLAQPSPLMIILYLSPVVVSLAFWLMGMLFVIYRPAGYIQRYLFIFCQLWAALLAFNSLTDSVLLQSIYFGVVLTAVFITVLLHLHFPVVVQPTPRRIIIIIVTVLIIVEALFEIYETLQPNFDLRFTLDALRSLLLFLSLLFALFMVVRAYFVSKIVDQKRQIGFITIGGGIAILPLFVFSLLPDLLQGYPIFPYELVVYLFVAIPISYGYAIWKSNFIQLARYASRTSAIIFSITIVGGVYIVLSYTFFKTPLQSNSQSILDIALIVLPLILFAPQYNRLQRWFDRLFFGGWYSYSSVVGEVSATLGQVDNSSSLPQILSNTVKQLMRLKWIGLFFPDEQGILQLSAFAGEGTIQSTIEKIKLHQNTVLIEYLKRSPKVREVQEVSTTLQGTRLTNEELTLLNSELVYLFVPIHDLTGSIGLFALGSKETGDPFDLDDIKILEVISRLTSITFQNFQLIHELEEKAIENEQYKREVIRVREAERKHISRELHDQIIQALVGLKYQISGLGREMPEMGMKTAESFNDLQGTVGSLIQTTRLLCQDLRPHAIDLGLIPSIRSIVHKFQTRSEATIELIVNGNRDILIDEDIALCLYRCISEALENAFKHAQATHIIVEIKITRRKIVFAVSDNGCGFVKPEQLGEFMKQNHYGLVGMRERIELLDGKYDVQTRLQNGTTIRAAIPIQNHINGGSVKNE